MNNTFELLTEKEAMWAQMLMQALQERLMIYVPKEFLPMANDLLHRLFSREYSEE